MAILLLALPGAMCARAATPPPQVQAADDFAAVADFGLSVLTGLYQEEQIAAIRQAAADEEQRAAREGRMPALGEAMEKAKQTVRARWRIVWGDDPDAGTVHVVGLWTLFMDAHSMWATAIESGLSEAATERARALVVDAYCQLAAGLPRNVPALLQVAGVSCPAARAPSAPALPIDAGTD